MEAFAMDTKCRVILNGINHNMQEYITDIRGTANNNNHNTSNM